MLTPSFKIAIVGTDACSYHLYSMVFKNDYRYDLLQFISMNETTEFSTIPVKTADNEIKRIPVMKATAVLSNNETKPDKYIFSANSLRSNSFLHLNSVCLSQGYDTIVEPFQITQLSPPKALISIFGDTQFLPIIMESILGIYQKIGAKPVAVFPMPLSFIRADEFAPVIYLMNIKEFDECPIKLDECQLELCRSIINCNVPVIFVLDFIQFCKESKHDSHYDLIFFMGYNTVPCFFSSHLFIYACDDFTFGECFDDHPSSSICQQSDMIMLCSLKNDDTAERLAKFANTNVISIPVRFYAKNQDCYVNKSILPIDDPYPSLLCGSFLSMSCWIASHFYMKPIVPYCPIDACDISGVTLGFDEPKTSISYPLYLLNYGAFMDQIRKSPSYDIIVSSTLKPIKLEIPKVLLQFSFKLDFCNVTEETISLPKAMMRIWKTQKKK